MTGGLETTIPGAGNSEEVGGIVEGSLVLNWPWMLSVIYMIQ